MAIATRQRGKPKQSGEGMKSVSEEVKWVQRFCTGDRQAFTLLYDRYAGLIRSIAYNTTGRLNDAQDIAQDVFLRAWHKREQLRAPAKFSSWLIGICRYACLEWLRKQGRDRQRYEQIPNLEDHGQVQLPDDDQAQELHHALRQLPDKERLAVQLHYLHEQPVEQARDVLSLSRSGFYKVLERALGKLRQSIGEHQESQS